jgi:hypothetical protein
MHDVEYTNEFEEWWNTLDAEQQEGLYARVERLEQDGPLLRRPLVGAIRGSRFDPSMKELICNEGGALRVLFKFDPRGVAILLIGGDKSKGGWDRWYDEAIPKADALYADHLSELKEEGLIE